MNHALYNGIIDYIENKRGIKLFVYQKLFLKSVLENKTVSMPIRSGRHMILKLVNDYLIYKHGWHRVYNQAEVHITLQNIIKEDSVKRSKMHDMVKDFEKNENKLKEYTWQWEKNK
ncbi:MAG: hypothetical protein LIR50_11450 [Bacillota bacterium]|nr:hypothetical protein [Bacillota bacterium]